MLSILLVVVLLLAVIFSDQFKFSIDGQFNPYAILSITLVGKHLFDIHILFGYLRIKIIYKFNIVCLNYADIFLFRVIIFSSSIVVIRVFMVRCLYDVPSTSR